MTDPLDIRVDPRPDRTALDALWRAVWGEPWHGNPGEVLSRSLVHIGAYDGERLVGYANVAWDGGVHAFLLDPTVHPDFRRRGLGSRLVRQLADLAAERGAAWLHVDFTPALEPFYRACGFAPTAAGLINLSALAPVRAFGFAAPQQKGGPMQETEAPYEHYEKEFRSLVSGVAKLETLFDNCRWAEGPVWFGGANQLLWSDIPNDRILRWIPGVGTSVFRYPAGNTNGHTRDREGRLVSCSHGNRRVERTEHDGSITVLATHYEGKRLNSPNDVVVKSDGSIWFTDPAYGIESDYEGHKSPMEQDGCHVYCIDPTNGKMRRVVDDMDRPNGLAFSLDEQFLYVADSAASFSRDRPHHIRRYKVGGNNRLSGGKVFADIAPGLPDGFRLDTDGNVWTSAEDGVHILSPSAVMIGKIKTPKVVANVCFGGPKNNWLFIACTDKMYLLHTMANGAQRP